MRKLPHYLYLVDQRLFAELLAVGTLLRKGLHCVLALVLVLDHQVHRRKIALPYLLDGLEQLVEAALVNSRGQIVPPRQQFLLVFAFAQSN